MLPMIIVGASTGVMLNKIFPAMVLAIALALLLVFISYKTLRKLLNICAEEKKRLGPACCGRVTTVAPMEQAEKEVEMSREVMAN